MLIVKYIYKHIYIDLNDCYLKCFSYINDMKTKCDCDWLCMLIVKYIYKHIYIDLNDCYSKCLSHVCMCACI